MNQAAQDTLALLLPPPQLADWIGHVIAEKLNKGLYVPETYQRWLYRVQMARLNLPRPEIISLTDEDWDQIKELGFNQDDKTTFSPQL